MNSKRIFLYLRAISLSVLASLVLGWPTTFDVKAFQTSTPVTYYVSADAAPGGDGTRLAPLDLPTFLDLRASPVRPGDTVIFLGGIYRIGAMRFSPGGAPSARTTFKAAPRQRVLFTTPEGEPPAVTMENHVRVEGLWFGGQQSPTADTSVRPGGGDPIGRRVQIVGCTFFGYREGLSQGGAEYNLYQGNRYVNAGRERYRHAMYISGGYDRGTMAQHSIVDNNIIIGSNGYAVHGWHGAHSNIVTRNFIADSANGVVMDGSQHLIANNFFWKMRGYPDDWRRVGAYLLGQNIAFFNNVMGPRANILYSHESNRLENNAFLDVEPAGESPVILTRGAESEQLGISEQDIDATVALLEQAFSMPVEAVYADQGIEPLFAKLKLNVTAGSPLYQAGKGWFGAVTQNIGSSSPAPGSEAKFWDAFRALGLRDFDRFGNVAGGDPDPPQVFLTDPVSGAILSGQLKLFAAAVDDVEVVGVQFKLDGLNLGEEQSSPFSVPLDTTALADGPHTLTAVARDVGGNLTASPPVAVTVSNLVGLARVSLSPEAVTGSRQALGTVTLGGPAISAGALVSLSSSDPAVASVPPSATIAGGTTGKNFNINTSPVRVPTTVQITAEYKGATRTASLTVMPPALSALTVDRTTLLSPCQGATGKVTINGAAPAGGAVVALASTNLGASVPPGVTVPAGATTATFAITPQSLTAQQGGGVTASLGGVSISKSFTVFPNGVASLTLSPGAVDGPADVSAAVTLSCPAGPGGLAVALSSSDKNVATVPASITIPAGATRRTFTVNVSRVSAVSYATIKAVANGVGKNAKLTINP